MIGRRGDMSKAKHILAVMAVTTALCADQVVSAAPMVRPQVANMAARLVDRLSQTFRRTVPDAAGVTVGRVPTGSAVSYAPQRPPLKVAIHLAVSPFQFRLPPPMA